MRRAIIFGFVLVCVTAVSFLSGSPVERKVLNPEGTTTLSAPAKPTQVEVTNFPAVQTVAGTVNVGNLTTDATGRVLVSIQGASNALVLRSTAATYQGNLGGRTGATQKCQAEFPRSHFAGAQEVFNATGTGTSFAAPGVIWLSSETSVSWIDQFTGGGGGANCGNWLSVTNQTGGINNGPGVLPKGEGVSYDFLCDQFLPILCAE